MLKAFFESLWEKFVSCCLANLDNFDQLDG